MGLEDFSMLILQLQLLLCILFLEKVLACVYQSLNSMKPHTNICDDSHA